MSVEPGKSTAGIGHRARTCKEYNLDNLILQPISQCLFRDTSVKNRPSNLTFFSIMLFSSININCSVVSDYAQHSFMLKTIMPPLIGGSLVRFPSSPVAC